MNATSLYVSTCRLVIQANPDEHFSWTDLYRLLPYLRQSLSCTVCGNLLIEPYTPTDTSCQHHVCKACRGGKKHLKPSCSWCKSYETYSENVQLRILLQCYKKLCEYIAGSPIYRKLRDLSVNGSQEGLLEIISEGTGFKDEYKSSGGLTKSAYSILPCVFPSPVPVTTKAHVQTQTSTVIQEKPPAHEPVVSKTEPVAHVPVHLSGEVTVPMKRIKVRHPRQKVKRKGCRCGNATPTPGKLTCCGQRCPCYVEGKSCVDCRCRGCRNPHTPAGKKLRPFENASLASAVTNNNPSSTACNDAQNLAAYISHGTLLYSNSPLTLDPVEEVPTTLLVDDEKSESDNSEIEVDI